MTALLRTTGLLCLATLAAGCLSLSAQERRDRAPSFDRLSGTFDLELTRGGDPRRAAEAATRSLPRGAERDRAYETLLARLEPPLTLSIDREGQHVTIASSRGPRSEFDADGRAHRERSPTGGLMTTRAEFVGRQLRVTTEGGSRGSDFVVTFETSNYGNDLRVTRRLDDEDLPRAVTIESYYRRTSILPRWNVYAAQDGDSRAPGEYRAGRGVATVPDGLRLHATLDDPIRVRDSRPGEPFAMTVESPAEFRGARLTGVISHVAARGTGDQMDLRLDFRSIEMSRRSSAFTGVVNTIRLPDGSTLRVNDDADLGDDDRGGSPVRNGAIGATVGAIIGAIAGGGKGAVLGAVIGAAGGVIVTRGREDLDLPRGTAVTVTAITGYRIPS